MKLSKIVLVSGLVLILPLLAILAAGFGKNPAAIPSPLIGKAAPPFALTPLGGGATVVLASMRGTPTVVNFWATWCEPCKYEHRVLQQTARALEGKVRFVGIVFDDEESRIRAFLDQHGSGYPTLIDKAGKAAIAFGVHGVPETFFIDANGVLVSKFEGPLDGGRLAEHLRPLLEVR